MKDRGKVIETIKKLILHQQSADRIGSREEALAFAAKITSLMREYRVERQEVEPTVADALGQDYGETLIAGYGNLSGEAFPWQAMLFDIVAKANACQTILIRKDPMRRFFVAGQTVDRAITVALARELCMQIELLSAEGYSELHGKDLYSVYSHICGDGSEASAVQREFFIAYRSGFMQALQQRLTEEEQLAITASESTALMTRTALQRTEKYIEKRFNGGAGEISQEIEIQDEEAALLGYRDGMAANLETNTLEQGTPIAKKQVGA